MTWPVSCLKNLVYLNNLSVIKRILAASTIALLELLKFYRLCATIQFFIEHCTVHIFYLLHVVCKEIISVLLQFYTLVCCVCWCVVFYRPVAAVCILACVCVTHRCSLCLVATGEPAPGDQTCALCSAKSDKVVGHSVENLGRFTPQPNRVNSKQLVLYNTLTL